MAQNQLPQFVVGPTSGSGDGSPSLPQIDLSTLGGMTDERAYQMRDLAHKNWSTERVHEPIHMIPLTPTLRSSALTRGFPLFQHAATVGLGAGATSLLQKYLDDQRKKNSNPTN